LNTYFRIHPRDKQDVAMRLVQGSLALGYKQNVSYQGPYPVKVVISQEEPYNYTQIEVEYTMSLAQKWLDGFEVNIEEGQYYCLLNASQ